MIRILTGCDVELALWIGEHLGTVLGPGAVLGFAGEDRLLAAIHYSAGGPPWASAEMSIYAAEPRWATRRTLHAAFAFPFLQLRVRRCGATIAAGNRRARALVERLGFILEGMARDAWLSDDVAIYGMRRAECRWLRARPIGTALIDVCPPLVPLDEMMLATERAEGARIRAARG